MTEKEFKTAESIFFYVAKASMQTVQNYRPDEEYRVNIPIATKLTHKEINYCESVYINLQSPTQWQLKAFKQRAEKLLPNRWYIETYHHLNIVRMGFK